MADDVLVKGKTYPMTLADAVAHGLAACRAVALAEPGPDSVEWSQSAAWLRLLLRELKPANERELPGRNGDGLGDGRGDPLDDSLEPSRRQRAMPRRREETTR